MLDASSAVFSYYTRAEVEAYPFSHMFSRFSLFLGLAVKGSNLS